VVSPDKSGSITSAVRTPWIPSRSFPIREHRCASVANFLPLRGSIRRRRIRRVRHLRCLVMSRIKSPNLTRALTHRSQSPSTKETQLRKSLACVRNISPTSCSTRTSFACGLFGRSRHVFLDLSGKLQQLCCRIICLPSMQVIYIWQDRRTGKIPTKTQTLRQSLAARRNEATSRTGRLGGDSRHVRHCHQVRDDD
jgi:hypothetical protein